MWMGDQMVMLRSGVDPRAARVWDVVLDAFRDMGATPAELRSDAWRLQNDPAFHHEWAVLLPVWCPSLAYYVNPDDDDEPGSPDGEAQPKETGTLPTRTPPP